MASKAETVRDQWKTALALITVANGYRNALTAAQVSKGWIDPNHTGIKFPHIVVELGDSIVSGETDDWNTFDEDVDFHVTGYVKADTETSPFAASDKLEDAMESMVHDLKKKILTDLIDVNITDATTQWNARLKSKKIRFRRVTGLGIPKEVGLVGCVVTIQIRNQDPTFA